MLFCELTISETILQYELMCDLMVELIKENIIIFII